MAPDRDFVVDLTATALADSVVCIGFEGCDDTLGAQVTFRCAGVAKTFDITLEQQGSTVVGQFSRAANEAGECTAIGGQRTAVDWDVILTRFENEAVRIEVTVQWTDFNDVLP